MVTTLSQLSNGHRFDIQLSWNNNCGQIVHTHAYAMKQYNLVLANGEWCCAAGMVGCPTDPNISTYELKAFEIELNTSPVLHPGIYYDTVVTSDAAVMLCCWHWLVPSLIGSWLDTASSHVHITPLATTALLLPVCGCGTCCLTYDRTSATDIPNTSWNHLCFGITDHGTWWLCVFCAVKYHYSLTECCFCSCTYFHYTNRECIRWRWPDGSVPLLCHRSAGSLL